METKSYIPLCDLEKKSKYDGACAYLFNKELRTLKSLPKLRGIGGVSLACSVGYVKELVGSVVKEYGLLSFPKTEDKEVMLLDSYTSATIEGARTTIDNVKLAINKPVKTKDELMVLNLDRATRYMLRKQEISEDLLLREWSIIVDGVCENTSKQGSKYRSGMVYVGGNGKSLHITESPENLGKSMESLFEFTSHNVHTILKAIISHFYLVYVHPFCDGNGRIARLFMMEVLCKGGYSGFLSTSVVSAINRNLSGYYSSIEKSEFVVSLNGRKAIDITPFIEYCCCVLLDSLDSYSKQSINLSPLEQEILQRMREHGSGVELSVYKASNIFNTTEYKARVALNSLSDKGFLLKYKSGGNMNIYRLY